MTKRIILFSLQTFSTTGGIQKMTRTLAHALHLLASQKKWDLALWSAYDYDKDLMPQYLPAEKFIGFGTNRAAFVLKTITATKNPDVIIISHINLALIGLLVRMTTPKCKIWLIAHGIEVWRPLSGLQNAFLKRCDKIICVSNFTKGQMIKRHNISAGKCEVLNNAVDPFIKLPEKFEKPAKLLELYGVSGTSPIIFTLTRLAATEQYKGHDLVIKVIRKLKDLYPGIKYILAGKYDYEEEIRIRKLIKASGVEEQVILTGFIAEAELTDYFLLADLFVLPSKKEGFGIVFIEALACGLPVVCGNSDGSVDAIRSGELGTAIDPDDPDELEKAICFCLENPSSAAKRRNLQAECLRYFNENEYIMKLEKMLSP